MPNLTMNARDVTRTRKPLRVGDFKSFPTTNNHNDLRPFPPESCGGRRRGAALSGGESATSSATTRTALLTLAVSTQDGAA
jgi:hypothetical protein